MSRMEQLAVAHAQRKEQLEWDTVSSLLADPERGRADALAAGLQCADFDCEDMRLMYAASAIEHAVDVVMVIKKTPLGRALFVTKNRFGPAHLDDPLLLELDDATLRLIPSRHAVGTVAAARSYVGGDCGPVEVQASVALAPYGSRGRLSAAGCRENMPGAVVTRDSLCKRSIADHISTTGDVPPGGTIEGREERFYVR